MFKLITKCCVMGLLSFNALANSPSTVLVKDQHIQSCPDSFYSIPLMSSAKFCQQFSTTPPASMSYFAATDQQTATQFYIDTFGQAETQQTLKGRVVLQYNAGNKIVIISPDGQGSQIDILVKELSANNKD